MKELDLSFYEEKLKEFKELGNLLPADTRASESLFDHLTLTAGIGVAIIKELLLKGLSPESICGEGISETELLEAVRLACLMHDWGKEEQDYRGHLSRSLEKARARLVPKVPLTNLILRGIERHHVYKGPETLFEKAVCLADSYASAGNRPEVTEIGNWDALLRFSQPNLELEKSLFKGDDGLALIMGDTDKVKNYVYETSKLPEIRGASEILKDLNENEIKDIFKNKGLSEESIIYAGGGSFLAISPLRLAQKLIEEIEKVYLRKTRITTITCVQRHLGYIEFARGHRPYADEEIERLKGEGIGEWLLQTHFGENRATWRKRKNFGEIVSFLTTELRLKKEGRKSFSFYPSLPIIRRCQSCGLRGVEHVVPLNGEEHFLCEICRTKRKEGSKFSFPKKFKDWLEARGEGVEKELENIVPKNLEDLAQPYEGYLCFLYVDGNDIGRLLDQARTPAHYRHISEELEGATREALFEALESSIDLKKLEKFPFEIINIGGDDISLFIVAPFAFKICLTFLQNFEEKLIPLARELKLNHGITASAGLVITKHTYPVLYMEKIASDLLKEAKKRAKEEEGYRSTFSYIYLTTPIAAESAKELIKESYHRERFCLTLRPYTLKEGEELLRIAEGLKKLLPSTQLNALAQHLELGPRPSLNFFLYQIGRLDEEKRREGYEILQDLSRFLTLRCPSLSKDFYFWGVNEEVILSTPLLDILEIIKVEGYGKGRS